MNLTNEKENVEINEIGNRELISNIADVMVSMLMNYGKIAKEDLVNFRIEFGYIFTINGSVEGLAKASTAKDVFYVAIQKNQMMLLEFNEELYQDTVKNMKSMHACLNETKNNESSLQMARRIKNNELSSEQGITTNENLINNVSGEIKKSVDQMCQRAIACLIVIQIACDVNNNSDYVESLNFFKPLLTRFGVQNSLNEKEQRIINGTFSKQDLIDIDWAYEAFWSLCWCLGLVDSISDVSQICDWKRAIDFIRESRSFEDFKSKCKLRPVSEILDMQDLYFRYNWAINNQKIDENTEIANLNPSVVIERRRGLEWVLSDIEDWYDISLNA